MSNSISFDIVSSGFSMLWNSVSSRSSTMVFVTSFKWTCFKRIKSTSRVDWGKSYNHVLDFLLGQLLDKLTILQWFVQLTKMIMIQLREVRARKFPIFDEFLYIRHIVLPRLCCFHLRGLPDPRLFLLQLLHEFNLPVFSLCLLFNDLLFVLFNNKIKVVYFWFFDHCDGFLGGDLLYDHLHFFVLVGFVEFWGSFLLCALGFFVGTVDLISLLQLPLNILNNLSLGDLLQILYIEHLDTRKVLEGCLYIAL